MSFQLVIQQKIANIVGNKTSDVIIYGSFGNYDLLFVLCNNKKVSFHRIHFKGNGFITVEKKKYVSDILDLKHVGQQISEETLGRTFDIIEVDDFYLFEWRQIFESPKINGIKIAVKFTNFTNMETHTIYIKLYNTRYNDEIILSAYESGLLEIRTSSGRTFESGVLLMEILRRAKSGETNIELSSRKHITYGYRPLTTYGRTITNDFEFLNLCKGSYIFNTKHSALSTSKIYKRDVVMTSPISYSSLKFTTSKKVESLHVIFFKLGTIVFIRKTDNCNTTVEVWRLKDGEIIPPRSPFCLHNISSMDIEEKFSKINSIKIDGNVHKYKIQVEKKRYLLIHLVIERGVRESSDSLWTICCNPMDHIMYPDFDRIYRILMIGKLKNEGNVFSRIPRELINFIAILASTKRFKET